MVFQSAAVSPFMFKIEQINLIFKGKSTKIHPTEFIHCSRRGRTILGRSLKSYIKVIIIWVPVHSDGKS